MLLVLAGFIACNGSDVDEEDSFHPRTGTFDESFTDSSGATGALRIIVPQDIADRDYGALLFFSWDGGDRWYKDEADLHQPLAAEHGLVMVSMATPSTPGTDGCWWAPAVEDNVAYVTEFIQQRLIRDLRINTDRIFLTGLSGGSDFAAEFHFLTDYAWRGGSVALCGGDLPRLNGGNCEWEIDPPEAPIPHDIPAGALEKVRYDFATTSNDYLRENAEDAADLYSDLGFTHVRQRIVSGSGHCGFTEGWEGLDTLADGLNFVDPRTNP
jgi:hypothetical protein